MERELRTLNACRTLLLLLLFCPSQESIVRGGWVGVCRRRGRIFERERESNSNSKWQDFYDSCHEWWMNDSFMDMHFTSTTHNWWHIATMRDKKENGIEWKKMRCSEHGTVLYMADIKLLSMSVNRKQAIAVHQSSDNVYRDIQHTHTHKKPQCWIVCCL